MRVLLAVVLSIGCGRIGFSEQTSDGASGDVTIGCAALLPDIPGGCALGVSQDRPYGLAITSSDVFWLSAGNGELFKCAKTGCGVTPTLIATGKSLGYFLAVDATHIYWNHNADGELLRCPLDGCPGGVPELLATTTSPTQVEVDAQYVYTSTNDGRLVRVPKTGGTPMDLATGRFDPLRFALAGNMFIWAIRGEDRLVTIPLGGGAPTDFVTGQNQPWDVAVDATHVVWSTFLAIMVSDRNGQNVQMLSDAESPQSVVIDGGNVYWANTGGTTVMRAPITGGAATPIATSIASPSQIAVDASHVYFTAYDSGTIYRVPK